MPNHHFSRRQRLCDSNRKWAETKKNTQTCRSFLYAKKCWTHWDQSKQRFSKNHQFSIVKSDIKMACRSNTNATRFIYFSNCNHVAVSSTISTRENWDFPVFLENLTIEIKSTIFLI